MVSISEPLVSIVTPFYNTVQYLDECIQSVLAQTYRNWEYILVNNCSTDGSDKIVDRYALNDHRIRVFNEIEFVGQLENYNRALRYISFDSKYCKMVQADDWIFPNCLKEMVSVAESSKEIGLVSSYSLYGDYVAHIGLPISEGPVYDGREAGRNQLLGVGIFGSATCVMYRSDIVRSRPVFFSPEVLYFEDIDVCFEILKENDFGFVPQVLSFNRRNNVSTWTKMDEYDALELMDAMFVHRYGKNYLNAAEYTKRVKETDAVLYKLLARRLLRGYGKKYWRFHVEGLASIGVKVSEYRLMLHMVSVLVDAIFNPKRSVEQFLHRILSVSNKGRKYSR